MKTSTERMIAKKDGSIGWMQFNNPARHNAVSLDMWKAVPEIMGEFEKDDQIRVVVVERRRRQGVRLRRRYFRVRGEAFLARNRRRNTAGFRGWRTPPSSTFPNRRLR